MGNNSRIGALRTALAIGLSLGIVALIILLVSQEPASALRALLVGPFTSLRRFGNVVEAMTPLIFTGLSVTLLYRAGLFNLSMEGGFFIAAVAATAAAVSLPLPPLLRLLVATLCAMAAGGLASLIPGILKVKCNAGELVTSLMLNYVLLYLGLYIVINFLHDPAMNANYSHAFPEEMLLPRLLDGTRINAGTPVAIVAVVLVYLLLNHSALGYKITLIGHNAKMAAASGIAVGRAIVLSQLLGGMLAGLGASMELFGMYKRFQYQGLPGYGWDGVLIAIVAQFRPEFIPLSAFFLAYLRIGADIMSRESDVPSEIIAIIQAVIIVLISAEALLRHYQQKRTVRQALREGAEA